MARPVIGLSPQLEAQGAGVLLRHVYLESIEGAGGIPLILPLVYDAEEAARLVSLCDGVIFTGGPDIAPEIYGEETLPECGMISPERDLTERLLFRAVFETEKPVLGICRGIQTINVFMGGTLFQDVVTQHPSETVHSMEPPLDRSIHTVTVKRGTPLWDILGVETAGVNSCHHQAVKDVAPGLEISAVSEDGLVEGIYLPGERFFCGVQWHPELMYKTDENSRKLFRAFVDAARQAISK